jgi:hypothetical protein
MSSLRKCSLCGYTVNENNDVSILRAIALFQICKLKDAEIKKIIKKTKKIQRSKHLFLTTNGEEIACFGSPNEAQYIPGQPRNIKSEYYPKKEKMIRDAFEKMQQLYP